MSTVARVMQGSESPVGPSSQQVINTPNNTYSKQAPLPFPGLRFWSIKTFSSPLASIRPACREQNNNSEYKTVSIQRATRLKLLTSHPCQHDTQITRRPVEWQWQGAHASQEQQCCAAPSATTADPRNPGVPQRELLNSG